MWASDKKKLSVSSTHVTVKVNTQKETCVYVRIKRDGELRKVMEAFSTKIGEEMAKIKFVFDGKRIQPYQTPNELELEDGDEIDAFWEGAVSVIATNYQSLSLNDI